MSFFILKEAKLEDLDTILFFVKKIAEYEKLSDQVKANKEDLKKWIFDKQLVHVLLCEENKKDIGYVVYFYNFSTFTGKAGLYLEDLYLLPEYRHKGYGTYIFKELANIALNNGCARFEWVCLNWNEPSKEFYKKMGAKPMSDWTTYRLDEEGIIKLGGKR
ncbi:MAG: GNAT family N-acetyltransferase [Bacilli bacterium]